MYEVKFRLDISPERYLAYYQGVARAVEIRLADGRRLQFPANAIQRFLRHDGIHGEFVLRFNEQHKLVEVQRVGR